MGSRLNHSSMATLLLPARFLTLVSHLIAVLLAFYSVDDNGRAALSTPYAQTDFDFVHSALIGGVSLFYVCAHFLGVVSVSLFVLDQWHGLTIWYLFVLFSAVPGAIEVGFLTNYLVLQKQ